MYSYKIIQNGHGTIKKYRHTPTTPQKQITSISNQFSTHIVQTGMKLPIRYK